MLLTDGCFAAVHFKNKQCDLCICTCLFANALARKFRLELIGVLSKLHIF